jgi:hypothetical protein
MLETRGNLLNGSNSIWTCGNEENAFPTYKNTPYVSQQEIGG